MLFGIALHWTGEVLSPSSVFRIQKGLGYSVWTKSQRIKLATSLGLEAKNLIRMLDALPLQIVGQIMRSFAKQP